MCEYWRDQMGSLRRAGGIGRRHGTPQVLRSLALRGDSAGRRGWQNLRHLRKLLIPTLMNGLGVRPEA